MSKTKTLFTMALLVLLGSMGAAQAQDFAEVKLFTTPEDFAREGGKNEAAGSILLNSSAYGRSPGGCNDHAAFLRSPCGRYRRHNPGTAQTGQVTVTGDTGAAVTGMAENDG